VILVGQRHNYGKRALLHLLRDLTVTLASSGATAITFTNDSARQASAGNDASVPAMTKITPKSLENRALRIDVRRTNRATK
jgi:hypothetical protein